MKLTGMLAIAALALALLLFGRSAAAQQTKVILIPASQEWPDTGLQVIQGETVTIAVKGARWSFPCGHADHCTSTPEGEPHSKFPELANADFLAPALPYWSLIAKIGSGEAFLIGTGLTFTAKSAGELYLSVNDAQGDFGNNLSSHVRM